MIRLLIIGLFLVYEMCQVVQVHCNVERNEGYYWRDFKGIIPQDALPGGRSFNGQRIYIGQVLDPEHKFLIPAKIYADDPRAYYELASKELNVTDNIKILCSQRPDQFDWIRTNNNDINLITDRDIMIGGCESESTTYIGRVRHGGEVLIGKALTDDPSTIGLYITSEGKSRKYTSYEVLSYNFNKGSSACVNSNTYNIHLYTK